MRLIALPTFLLAVLMTGSVANAVAITAPFVAPTFAGQGLAPSFAINAFAPPQYLLTANPTVDPIDFVTYGFTINGTIADPAAPDFSLASTSGFAVHNYFLTFRSVDAIGAAGTVSGLTIAADPNFVAAGSVVSGNSITYQFNSILATGFTGLATFGIDVIGGTGTGIGLGSLTMTTNPEPTSMCLMGLGMAVAGGGSFWRKRRNKGVAAQPEKALEA